MKILFAGDWHGDINHVQYIYQIAIQKEVDYVIQVGDFGYWEHMQGGPEFLDMCQKFADESGIDLWWIDGNHENFDWLYDYPLDSDGRRPVRPNVIHLPRGHKWKWDGVTFLAFGGSFSIDRGWRKLGSSYWEEELPTVEEATKARAQGKVDVMVTHDVPDGADLSLLLGPDWKAKSQYPQGCVDARARVREVWEVAQPAWLFHGHYHQRADSICGDTRIVGLANERTGPSSYTLFDTDELG